MIAIAFLAVMTTLSAPLDQLMQEHPEIPSIVVHMEGPELPGGWTGVVGVEARGTETPLTASHTFRIASNTKTYVAAAVLRLVESGRLGLHDPLGAHLPDTLRTLLVGDGYDLEAITIGHVLSHTAGLNDHTHGDQYADAILADPRHPWTRLEQVTRCVEWQDPLGDPGCQWSYSDTGYVLLGSVIEMITARPLGIAVRDLLDYHHLGLESTAWETVEPDLSPRAHQYYGDLDSTAWDPSLDLYGGGGLVADARDLGLFLRALMHGEVFARRETLQAMMRGGARDYGFGLMRKEFSGHEAWGHQGFWNTFVYHVPDLDLTIAGSINQHDTVNGLDLVEELVEAYTSLQP